MSVYLFVYVISHINILYQCFSTFFASRPKMSDCNLSATLQPLNTTTSVLYVGEFGQHFSVRISFYKKVVGQSRDPTKIARRPQVGSRPRG